LNSCSHFKSSSYLLLGFTDLQGHCAIEALLRFIPSLYILAYQLRWQKTTKSVWSVYKKCIF